MADRKDRAWRGITYDSKAEMTHAMDLEGRARRLGLIVTRQVPFELNPNGESIKYVADFLVHARNGTLWVEETKGMETPAWKLKAKLFRTLFPEIDLRVFDGKGRLTIPKRRARYAEKG